jgi:hypothetical protein
VLVFVVNTTGRVWMDVVGGGEREETMVVGEVVLGVWLWSMWFVSRFFFPLLPL